MLDRLYFNGIVRTMGEENPIAQALGVLDGKIVFVGSDDEAKMLEAAEKIDLDGKLMLPGFNEGHMHLGTYSFANMNVKLFETKSVEECLERMKARLEETPDMKWMYARGFNDQSFEVEKRYPTREELDSVSNQIPIMAVRACGHAAVVNSVAMDKIVKLPEAEEMLGNRIHPETGEVDEAAVKLFYKVMDELTVEDAEKFLSFGMKKLAECGITSCQTDDLKGIPAAQRRTVIQA